MGDKTGIEWTEATTTVDRGGRRTRTYIRKKPGVPGRRRRTEMAAIGMKWCRSCEAWLPTNFMTRSGLCREHARQDYRARYAADPSAIKARVHARKRNVAPVPPDADLVAELFDHKCAYCGGTHDAWDHVHPVKLGGQTVAGNIVPTCVRGNSSKKAMQLADWLDLGAPITEYMAEYMIGINQGI